MTEFFAGDGRTWPTAATTVGGVRYIAPDIRQPTRLLTTMGPDGSVTIAPAS